MVLSCRILRSASRAYEDKEPRKARPGDSQGRTEGCFREGTGLVPERQTTERANSATGRAVSSSDGRRAGEFAAEGDMVAC